MVWIMAVSGGVRLPSNRDWARVVTARTSLLLALVLAACGGAAPTPQIIYVTPAPATPTTATEPTETAPPDEPTVVPTIAATAEPTLDLSLYEGLGVITFGTAYDEDTLLITKETSHFKRTYPEIAWSALMTRSVGATSIEFVLASQSASGIERVILSEEHDVSNPDSDLFANSADLASFLDNKAGTYVMRYIESGEVLAEGTFTLVK